MVICALDFVNYNNAERVEIVESLFFIERMTYHWAGNTAAGYSNWPKINGHPVGYVLQPNACSIPRKIIFLVGGEFKHRKLPGLFSGT